MQFDEFSKQLFENQKFLEAFENDLETYRAVTRALATHARFYFDQLVKNGFNENQALMIVCYHGCMAKLPGK